MANNGNNNGPDRGRDMVFDALKGIAMLLVVADHCGLPLLTVFDYFEVPAFFIISGFFFRGRSGFLLEKMKRLIVPYIIYNVAYMAAWASVGGEMSWNYLVNGFLWSANYPLWFFKALFWTFVLAYAFAGGGRWLSRGSMSAVSAVFVVAGTGVSMAVVPVKLLPVGLLQAVVVLPLFCLGFLLRSSGLAESIKGWFGRRWVAVAAGVVVLCICSLLWHGALGLNDANIGNAAVFYIYTPVVFLGFYLLGIGLWSRVADVLAYVGRRSLFIFCVHAIVILYLRQVLENDIAIFVVTASLSVALAAVAGRVPRLRRMYLA